MNWNDIHLFHAAAIAGSMTAASRRLDISQPQLSRRLRQMEEAFGARLFERTPQGLKLTRAGDMLLPLAEDMRHAADAVLRVQPNLPEQGLKKVRLSIDDLRTRFLILHMKELKSLIGPIQLDLISTHEHLSLVDRTTDIQIRSCMPDSESMIVRKVGDVGYGLYASHDYMETRSDKRLETLKEEGDWLGICADPIWHHDPRHWINDNVQAPIQFHFNCIADLYEATRAGLGITILPRFLADNDPTLACIERESIHVSAPEHLMVNRDLLREPAIRTLVDALAHIYRHMT